MRWIKSLFLGLILAGITDSCLQQPEYSVIPSIELLDVTFKPGNLAQQIQDTLIITLKFRDGDGDLGIGPDDSATWDSYSPWYWAYDTVNFNLGYTGDNTVTPPPGYKYINYRAKFNVPPLDTLPLLDCKNWEELYRGQVLTDTLYITQNLKAFNINVDIYTSSTGGAPYTKFDPSTYFTFPGCNVNMFRGGFPNLSSDVNKKSPLDGVLTYKIQSFALKSIFNIATLKIEVQINDRAYNLSNLVEKEGFTLSSITK